MKKNELTKAMKEVIAIMVSQLFNGMKDEEILTANKTEKIGESECSTELLSDLLGFAKEQFDNENAAAAAAEKKALEKAEKEATAAAAEETEFHGNRDTKKEFPMFPKAWADSVIIRESMSAKIGPKSKDVVEIPSSVKFGPYDKSLFDTHVKNGMFEKKNVLIIHDPR